MTVRSYHIESTEGILKDKGTFEPGTRYFGRGLGKEYKAIKRAEAVARQQKLVERGWYINKDTKAKVLPVSPLQFMNKAERIEFLQMQRDVQVEAKKVAVRVMTPDEKAAKKARLHAQRNTKA